VSSVRLISETGKQVGVVSVTEALNLANRAGLDLVEISPNANPPVCKILDFGQYYYQKERKMRDARKHQHIVQVKEVKFTPSTDNHDLEFKLKHALKFLKQHHKVKFTIWFRGRQLAHKDIGQNLLDKVLEELKPIIEVEGRPVSAGRTLSITVSPHRDIDKLIEDFENKTKEE